MAWTSPSRDDGRLLPYTGLRQKLRRPARGGEAHREEDYRGVVGWIGCQRQEPGQGFQAEEPLGRASPRSRE